ncbi:hypothetical protein OROHE_003173 [Orobanche hederae]
MQRMDKNIQTAMADHWLKLLICLVVVINATNAMEKGAVCMDGSPAGQVEEIGGLNCYVTGPKDSNISVILATDVFGFEVPHLRKIADKVGAAGFYTLVPDFFHGDPFVSGRPEKPFQDWIKEHPAKEKGIKDAKAVIKALESKGITKIGAAGFCWGGKPVVDLTKRPSIQAVVLLHPTYVTIKDIEGVEVPISILGGQNDTMSPPSLLKQYDTALKAKHKVNSFVKIFPGAEHGWTTRYNDTDAPAVKRAKKAHKYLLHWLVKYLK